MTCGSGGKITKKKVIILSAAASGMAAVTYVVFTSIHNLAIAATMLAFLPLAACPAMCAGMGVVLWLQRRVSGKNRNKNQILKPKEEASSSCCSSSSSRHVAQGNETQHEMSRNSKLPESKNEADIDVPPYYLQAQKAEFEN